MFAGEEGECVSGQVIETSWKRQSRRVERTRVAAERQLAGRHPFQLLQVEFVVLEDPQHSHKVVPGGGWFIFGFDLVNQMQVLRCANHVINRLLDPPPTLIGDLTRSSAQRKCLRGPL